MSEQMTRAEVRRTLEQAAFSEMLPTSPIQAELCEPRLFLAAATLRPLLPEQAFEIGAALDRYERLVREIGMLTLARDRGNTVDFWRYVASVERLAQGGDRERA